MKKILCTVLSILIIVIGSTLFSLAKDSIQMSVNPQFDNDKVVVLINMEASLEVAVTEFTLKYDAARLTVEDAELQGEFEGMSNAINTKRLGEITVAMASAVGIDGNGDVMKITFDMKSTDDSSDLKFILDDISVGDESGNVLLKDESLSAELKLKGSSDSGSGSGHGSHSGTKVSGDPTLTEIYADVPESHWAYEQIMQAYDMKLMQGYGEGIFRPDGDITRAQMATVLWNAAGNPEPSKTAPFTDLTQEWYKDAIAWAAENELVHGMGDGRYDPEGTLTREQLSQILYNKNGNTSGMETLLYGVYDGQYEDSVTLSNWARPAFYWTLYKGILCGTDSAEIGDKLSSTSSATRAQIAVMLTRYENIIEGK